jgi:hypothetical protein
VSGWLFDYSTTEKGMTTMADDPRVANAGDNPDVTIALDNLAPPTVIERTTVEKSKPQIESELKIKEWKEQAKIQRENWLFAVGLSGTAALLAVCSWAALFGNHAAETTKWAQTVLTIIVSGFIGYLTGSRKKDADK